MAMTATQYLQSMKDRKKPEPALTGTGAYVVSRRGRVHYRTETIR